MDKFYYDLLNIGNQKSKEQYFKIVKEVIETEAEIFRDDNPRLDRLCKFVANNIKVALSDRGINSKIVNTSELYDMYEHHFVISSYTDDMQVKYILIDPTFTQFRHQNNDYHNTYPVDILCETKEGINLAYNLLKRGYSQINNNDLKRYIASIKLENDISTIDVTIDDIMLERRQK